MDENTNLVQIAGLTLDPATGGAFLEGQPLELTRTEFRLLLFLMQSDGSVFARKDIVAAVQGDDYPATDHSVDVHVMSLRRKLGSHAHLIETVRGAGYRRRTLQLSQELQGLRQTEPSNVAFANDPICGLHRPEPAGPHLESGEGRATSPEAAAPTGRPGD